MALVYKNNVYTWVTGKGEYDVSDIEDTVHCANDDYLYYIRDDKLYRFNTRAEIKKATLECNISSIYKMMYYRYDLVLISLDKVYYKENNLSDIVIHTLDTIDIEILNICKKYIIYRRGDKCYKNKLDMQISYKTIWYNEGHMIKFNGNDTYDHIGKQNARVYELDDYIIITNCARTTIIHPDNSISRIYMNRYSIISQIESNDTTLVLIINDIKYVCSRSSLYHITPIQDKNCVYEISKPIQMKSARNI